MPIRPASLAAALALCAALAGCASPAGTDHPGTARPAGQLNATDIAWAQLMLAMNDRALALLSQSRTRAASRDLMLLTSRIASEHRSEQTRLRDLLALSGAVPPNPHEAHDMPGMITRADLTMSTKLRGASLDHLVISRLYAHLSQSALITTGERTSGSHPTALSLATEISQSRTTQLAALSHVPSGSAG